MWKKLLLPWLISLVVFGVLDIITTYYILESGGSERNRIFKTLVEDLGLVTAILIIGSATKAVAIIAIFFGFKYFFNKVESDKIEDPRERLLYKVVLYFGMGAVFYVFLLPVINNLNQMNL